MTLYSRRLPFVAVLTVMVLATASLVFATAPPANSQTSSLSSISQAIFACMQRHTDGIGGWIVYDGGTSGKIKVYAAGAGQVGEVNYRLDADQETLNLSYVRGPAPFAQIRQGLNDTATKCQNGEYD